MLSYEIKCPDKDLSNCFFNKIPYKVTKKGPKVTKKCENAEATFGLNCLQAAKPLTTCELIRLNKIIIKCFQCIEKRKPMLAEINI